MTKQKALELRKKFNALAELEGRDGKKPQDFVNEELVIKSAVKIENYYAVCFFGKDDVFMFTPSALTQIIEDCGEDDIEGIVIKIKPQRRTKNNRDFNPIEIVGFSNNGGENIDRFE